MERKLGETQERHRIVIPPSLRTSPRSLRVDIKNEQKGNTENLYSNARFNKQGLIVVYTFTVLLLLNEISYWFFTIAFLPLLGSSLRLIKGVEARKMCMSSFFLLKVFFGANDVVAQ